MGDLGRTGNKYDAGRCGDCTLGNATKMSQLKAISFLDDGEMESSKPGVIVHQQERGLK
jgi:hypothetical protein